MNANTPFIRTNFERTLRGWRCSCLIDWTGCDEGFQNTHAARRIVRSVDEFVRWALLMDGTIPQDN